MKKLEENHAPANVGQLKHVASMAWLHLELTLPDGAGFVPGDLWTETPVEENYAPINIGQLKAVAKPFYDRLHAEVDPLTNSHLSHIGFNPIQHLLDRGYPGEPNGWPHDYPWDPADPVEENYAPANVGQLKMVFGFEVPPITEEPFLTATCQEDPEGILLECGDPKWGDYVEHWFVERATHPQGEFTEIANWTLYEGQNPTSPHREYLDENPPQTIVPTAQNQQSLATCKDTAIQITLRGSDPNELPLTFSIVDPPDPLHGSLGAITQLTDNSAEVWFTPAAGYCGQAGFTFKVTAPGTWPSEDLYYRIRYSYWDGSSTRDSHYSNVASPTGNCVGNPLDSQPAAVTINVGGTSPNADCSEVMTEKGEPITITLCGSDSCGDDLTFTVVDGPSNGTLGTITPVSATCSTVIYTPDTSFEGTDTFSFTAENCGGFSSGWQTATIHVVPGPELTATCGPDSILLRWVVPPWAGDLATDFQIKRKTAGGTYSVIHTAGASERDFEDTTVYSEVTYCYIVVMRRQSPCDSVFYEVESNEVCLQTCGLPPCNEPTISDWVFTDQGFIGSDGTLSGAWRTYTDPAQATDSPWSFPTTPDCLVSPSGLLLRMNFENDNTCENQGHDGPSNPFRQIATAEAVISVSCLTRLRVDWCGLGEEHQSFNYELMTLHVNDQLYADAHAPGSDGNQCASGMGPAVPRAGSPLPPQEILLEEGIHLLRIRTDTGDWRFHFGAYYEFKFFLEPLQ